MRITINYEMSDRIEVSAGGSRYAHRIDLTPPHDPGWRGSVVFPNPSDGDCPSWIEIEAQGPRLIECLRSALSMLERMDESYREGWAKLQAHSSACPACGSWRDSLNLNPHGDGKGGLCDAKVAAANLSPQGSTESTDDQP